MMRVNPKGSKKCAPNMIPAEARKRNTRRQSGKTPSLRNVKQRLPGITANIDLLVLLSPPLDYFAELWQIVNVLYPLQLESDHLISAKPVSIKDFEAGSVSLYRNAKREGVTV
jgi:hypothetical protein